MNREWRFQTWADETVVISTSDEDPGDMGEPVAFDEDGVHYFTVRAALAEAAPAPDLIAAVETFTKLWRSSTLTEATMAGPKYVIPTENIPLLFGAVEELRAALVRVDP